MTIKDKQPRHIKCNGLTDDELCAFYEDCARYVPQELNSAHPLIHPPGDDSPWNDWEVNCPEFYPLDFQRNVYMDSNTNILIVGLGYVGLPLLHLLKKKYNAYGYDNNRSLITSLKDLNDPTGELIGDDLIPLTSVITSVRNSSIISNVKFDFIIVTVPTPITHNNFPDLTPVLSATSDIAPLVSDDTIVIYESTYAPTTTRDIVKPYLHSLTKSKFQIAYSPERINPNDPVNNLTNIVKLVSAEDPGVAQRVKDLYDSILDNETHLCPSMEVAEASKMLENIQRDVNIALMNEYSTFLSKLDIGIYDVLQAAYTKWNFCKFTPGIVGGHCIGVDPYYVLNMADHMEIPMPLIKTAREVNESFSKQYIHHISTSYNQVAPFNCLIMGASFKPDCPDTRNSAGLKLYTNIHSYFKNAKVDLYDPISPIYQRGLDFTCRYNVVIIACHHSVFRDMDWESFITKNLADDALVIDSFNKFKDILIDQDNIFYISI